MPAPLPTEREALPLLPERYRCTRILGEGATGIVYHAEDRLLPGPATGPRGERRPVEVAVKVVKTNLALHRRFRARFAREVAMSARIVHPHVVPVYDTGALPTGEPFVVLGYANHGSLADVIRRAPQIEDMLRLVDEVLDALAAIHARWLLHQDLKPSNILLHTGFDGRPHAWVADLGVADALAELNRDRKGISGTPGYMAPEQLEGRTQDLGPWTDLYAVGLILYETLAGEKPHPGEGRAELLEARLKPPPPMKLGRNLGVPAALREVINGLLDPEPRQRFDRAADVRRALRDAIKGFSFRGRVRYWRPVGKDAASTAPTRFTGDFPLSVPAPSGPVAAGTLRYNRVAPDNVPHDPHPDRGWEAPARASLALFALREVPLVGRDRERKLLWDAAREVVALGEPRVVLTVGESGTGKTRLVESVANAFEENGYMEVVRLRYHDPPGVDDGYRGAVRDLLVPWNDTRDGIETRLSRWLSRDRQVLPEAVHEEAVVLARWCGYVREGETPVSEAVGLAYLYRHIDVRAWRGGTCLILEDVHYAQADGDGLAIAEALLDRTVGERPAVVFCTLSAEALLADAALRRKVEGLQQRGARRINLRRLSLPETRRVVQESLLLQPELAQAVSLECEGDPLAAGLLLREWASRRLIVPGKDGHYVLPPSVTAEAAFPPDLDSIVRRRLQAALDHSADPAAATETVAAVALAGQEPPTALIRAVNDAGLDALLATGLVAEQRGFLVFEHSRIYQKALELAERLPNAKDLHKRLADAWEELGAATGLDVSLPHGLHRLRSGEPDRAVSLLLTATASLNLGGRRDGIRAAAMAIEAADAVGQPTARLEARRLHAEALLEAGEPERALPLIEHALKEVEGDRIARARLRVLLARALRKQGDLERAQRELEAARNVFAGLRDRGGLIEVALQKARLARVEGRSDNAITHWNEILRMNRGDLVMEAEALNGLVEAMIRAGQLNGIERHVERLQSVARTSGDTRRIAEAMATVGLLHMERGEYEEARVQLQSAGAVAATLGADALHLRCRSLLADVLRHSGDLEAAEETTRWVARFASERAHTQLVAAARVQLALLALARGDPRRVRSETEAAAEALQQSPRHGLWLQIGVLRAMLAAESGDERACQAWFAVATERGLGADPQPDLRFALERLSEAAERNGWTDLHRRALARLVGDGPTNPEAARKGRAPTPPAPPPPPEPEDSRSTLVPIEPVDPGETSPMSRRPRPIRDMARPHPPAPLPEGEPRGAEVAARAAAASRDEAPSGEPPTPARAGSGRPAPVPRVVSVPPVPVPEPTLPVPSPMRSPRPDDDVWVDEGPADRRLPSVVTGLIEEESGVRTRPEVPRLELDELPEAALEPVPEAALEPVPEAALELMPEAALEPMPEAAPEPAPDTEEEVVFDLPADALLPLADAISRPRTQPTRPTAPAPAAAPPAATAAPAPAAPAPTAAPPPAAAAAAPGQPAPPTLAAQPAQAAPRLQGAGVSTGRGGFRTVKALVKGGKVVQTLDGLPEPSADPPTEPPTSPRAG